ncbi:MAG: hypothetical protein ACJ8AP_12280 [Gemmatimonadales bacterium]
MTIVRICSFALLSMLPACQRPANRSSSEPHLELTWSGKDGGKLSGAATAEWCEPRRILEIHAIQGDTGAALALHPERALAAGSYPVVDPPKAESLPPAAGIAVRWLGQTVVQGFQGDSGSVILERSSTGVWSGRFGARARSVADTQRIRLHGSFRDLVVKPAAFGCEDPERESDMDPEPPDSSVH